MQQSTTIRNMPITTNTPLSERARQNIRVMKAVRGMSAANIASLGGFSSRQVVADRLVGRTPLSLDDIYTIARALRIDPVELLKPADELMRWVSDHPDYVPPTEPRKPRRRK